MLYFIYGHFLFSSPHPPNSTIGSPPYSSAAPTPSSVSSYQHQPPPNAGWNDPPPLKGSSKKTETTPPAPAPQQPITQPIYGAEPVGAPGGPTGYTPAAGIYNPGEYQPPQAQPGSVWMGFGLLAVRFSLSVIRYWKSL